MHIVRKLNTPLLLLAVAVFLLSATAIWAADNFTNGETVSLAATSTSSSVSFTLAQSANYPDVMVTNSGSVTVFVGCNGSGVANLPGAGMTNAMPVLAGGVLVIHKGNSTVCAAITAASSGTVYFTAGEGS